MQSRILDSLCSCAALSTALDELIHVLQEVGRRGPRDVEVQGSMGFLKSSNVCRNLQHGIFANFQQLSKTPTQSLREVTTQDSVPKQTENIHEESSREGSRHRAAERSGHQHLYGCARVANLHFSAVKPSHPMYISFSLCLTDAARRNC
jgi:hypothetical protein